AVRGDVALGDVRITDGSASYVDRAAGVEHALTDLNIAVSLPSLAEPFAVRGDLVLDGEPISLDARVETLRAFLDGEAAPFRVNVDSALFTAKADGRFEPGADTAFSGDVELAAPSLRGLAAFADAELPPGEVYESFSVSGRASGDATSIAFEDAKVAFDAIRAEGAFRADLSGAKPVVSGTLDVGALDVTPYMPVPADTGGGSSGSGGAPSGGEAGDAPEGVPPWSDDPIDVTALTMVDAAFDLSVASIRVDTIDIGQSRVKVELRDGRLQADLTELAAYDGAGTASVTVNARGATPAFALSADLQGFQAQPFLAAVAGFDRVTGGARAQLSLSGSGASTAALMSDLDGTGSFAFEDGALRGVNLGAIARGLQAALAGDLSLDAFASNATTDFSELGASFILTDGVARSDDFELLSPLVRVGGDGALDIGGQSVDFTLRPRLVASAEGQGGTGDEAGLGVPVSISGGWSDVKLGVDRDALQAAIAAEARDEARDEISKAIDRNLGDSDAADLALWPITITAAGDDLAALQEKIEADNTLITNFLTAAGFDQAEISLGRLQLEDRVAMSWGSDQPSGGRYLINQPITVRTSNVDLVAAQSRRLGAVVRQGVVVTGWQGPTYIFTGLNDIKPEMLEAATTNAREAAEEFAEDADARLGGIRSANQGVFEILPRDRMPNASESDQIFKTVRVVATITYFLDS
ncbi:MAG: SIMPL domain-containing protein, partial [Caulobacterales bacterium]|nr:SIMPL domain-containing protein [Caulobacterales bacterium]